jgi:carbamate kinase
VERTAVIALGGNALTRENEVGSYDQQLANARSMARSISSLLAHDWRVVVVHGNGPQVGNLAIQAECAADVVPPQPLFSLDAMTQGQLGSMIGLALREECGDAVKGVVSIVTHVIVRRDDPGFGHPTKPIGPFFNRERAEAMAAAGRTMAEDAGRGFRQIVASPQPVAVLEADAVRELVESGYLVVACGGGGVPVARTVTGYRGIEAVIDKDYSAQRLATTIGAEALVLVTGVESVQVNFGTPEQRPVHEMCLSEAEDYSADGQFPSGSMGPKVDACLRFLHEGGSVAVITVPELVLATLEGGAADGAAVGTRIVPNRVLVGGG